jgi:hypothetical protein
VLVGVREVAVAGPSSGYAGALIRAPVRFQRPPCHSVRRVYPSTAGRPACQAAPSQCILVCICPSRLPWQRRSLRSDSESERPARWDATVRVAFAALPQRPSLRSGLFCPGPSSLTRPHPPHSPAHRDFACGLYAVPSPFEQPFARPVSGSALSLPVPSRHAVFSDPGGPPPACTQLFGGDSGLRRLLTGSATSHPTTRSTWGYISRLNQFTCATACRVACLPGESTARF